MKPIRFLLICFLFTPYGCSNSGEDVIVTEYNWDGTIKSQEILQFTISQSDTVVKYRVTGDSSSLLIWFPFDKPVDSDSIIYIGDYFMTLVEKKLYDVDGIDTEVLKYEYNAGNDTDMTLFLNQVYGPIIVRSDSWGNYITYDKPKDPKRKLIQLIKLDSIDFGGV